MQIHTTMRCIHLLPPEAATFCRQLRARPGGQFAPRLETNAAAATHAAWMEARERWQVKVLLDDPEEPDYDPEGWMIRFSYEVMPTDPEKFVWVEMPTRQSIREEYHGSFVQRIDGQTIQSRKRCSMAKMIPAYKTFTMCWTCHMWEEIQTDQIHCLFRTDIELRPEDTQHLLYYERFLSFDGHTELGKAFPSVRRSW